MTFFRTLDNADLNNKRVLLRVDLNVPMENGKVTDATRIERVVPTITEIADKGGKVIILAHFGRPKGRDEKDSLKPVAAALSQIIKRPVAFADDCIGDAAKSAVDAMKRATSSFWKTPASTRKRKRTIRPLSRSSLRSATSMSTTPSRRRTGRTPRPRASATSCPPMPAAPCRPNSMRLSKALVAPAKPVIAIVGGAKVSTKIELLENMIDKVDALVIGGGMANTFLHAQGINIGKSLAERDLADLARRIMAKAEDAKCAIILPVDAIVAHEFKANAPSHAYGLDAIPADGMILDVGPLSIERVNTAINDAVDLALERPARRIRADAVRQGHGCGSASRRGTDQGRKACLDRRRRRYCRGAEPRRRC